MFVLVMAKEPVPGRVKTRLCPPCTPSQASDIAAAALADTFDAATASGADEVVAALDGSPGPWLPAGVRVVPQVDESFDRRLAAAWAQTSGAGIQIGMDTPQITGAVLDDAMALLTDHDAVLGEATDGGWWAIGLHEADERVFHGVPMSTDHTGAAQRARLESLGLRVGDLPRMTDVDHFAEASTVAESAPDTRFAEAVRRVHQRPTDGVA
ncbi:TIGR04282 family arsenosugar biosynthesis glycosyltransferase [Actinospongicola halichondriae]|uniref:TIGR04282 family arsenosugar biosynthesis glycosyltransferase n=1 Tax=Actinospongicola halichondriae TaxID=3236844 RepID=UPI003D43803F